MDSSLTVRPRDALARTAVGRQNAVRTDLSPSQSVNAPPPVAAAVAVESALHEATIDPQCRALLDREREEREEKERRQARKDAALACSKAYGRPAEAQSATDDDRPHADIAV